MATKLFGTEARNTFIPREAQHLLHEDARRFGNDQGRAYVAASSKKAAGELLERAGLSMAKSSLALDRACGNDLKAVQEAGEAPVEGSLIVLPLRGSSVLHYSEATGWTLIGKVTPAGFVSRARLTELSAALDIVHANRAAHEEGGDIWNAYTTVLDAARDRLVQLRVAFGEA